MFRFGDLPSSTSTACSQQKAGLRVLGDRAGDNPLAAFRTEGATMSEVRQSYIFGTMLLLGIGLLSLFGGLVLLSERATVSALLFGASPSLGVPATGVDLLKSLYVDSGAVIAMAQGAILFVVGLFRLARTERTWGSVTTPASR
jgi:hypothetical protein